MLFFIFMYMIFMFYYFVSADYNFFNEEYLIFISMVFFYFFVISFTSKSLLKIFFFEVKSMYFFLFWFISLGNLSYLKSLYFFFIMSLWGNKDVEFLEGLVSMCFFNSKQLFNMFFKFNVNIVHISIFYVNILKKKLMKFLVGLNFFILSPQLVNVSKLLKYKYLIY